jgi:hypothetical protein
MIGPKLLADLLAYEPRDGDPNCVTACCDHWNLSLLKDLVIQIGRWRIRPTTLVLSPKSAAELRASPQYYDADLVADGVWFAQRVLNLQVVEDERIPDDAMFLFGEEFVTDHNLRAFAKGIK